MEELPLFFLIVTVKVRANVPPCGAHSQKNSSRPVPDRKIPKEDSSILGLVALVLVLKSARGSGDRFSIKASCRGGIRRLDLNLGQFMPKKSSESQANQDGGNSLGELARQ
jgi:hypothetical protein